MIGLAICGWLAMRPGPHATALPPRATVSAPVALSPGAGASTAALSVYVVGEVRRPGVVSVGAGARVDDAIEAAGGASAKADLTAINLARRVTDGEQLVVPRPGQVVAGPPKDAAAGGDSGPLVNLNTASETQLDELPGIGPVLAGRIVAWRQQNGRFASTGQLGEVEGIGDATLAKLQPLVTV